MAKDRVGVHGSDQETGRAKARAKAQKDEDGEKSCPITKKQFKDNAEGIPIKIAGQDYMLQVKEFSSGTFGWFVNGSFKVIIDGTEVRVPFQVQAYVPHSKEAKDE